MAIAVSVTWLVLCSLTMIVSVSAMSCLYCPKVYQPQDCARLISCPANQGCFSKRYKDISGREWYSLGCTDLNTCNDVSSTIFGKRSGQLTMDSDDNSMFDHGTGEKQARQTDVTNCQQCCNDTAACNRNLCGANATQYLKCLSCQDVMNPRDCDSVRECSKDNFCYVHANGQHGQLLTRYDMGCMADIQCDALKLAYRNSCIKCCNNDFCNLDACDDWKPSQ